MKLYYLSIIPIFMSLSLIYMFPFDEQIPLVIFWVFLTYFILNTLLKEELRVIKDYKKHSKWAIFISYLIAHYFAYSVIIIELLTYIYKPPPFYSQTPLISIFNTPFGGSQTLVNLGLSIVLNPTVFVFIPPNIFIDLSLYSMAMGLYIAILVTSSLISIIGTRKRLKYIAIVPTLGIVAGASCCLSVPVLLSVTFYSNGIISLPIYVWQTVFITYISLPLVTVMALKHISNLLLRFRSKEFTSPTT